jgi:hypothetical protein
MSALGVSAVALGACTGSNGDAERWLQPVANERLVGVWEPTDVERIPGTTDRWRLMFDESGRWHGIDACNRLRGRFTLFEDGTFDGGQIPGDFHGGFACDSEAVDYFLVMERTVRVDIAGHRATFVAADGDELMVLNRLN